MRRLLLLGVFATAGAMAADGPNSTTLYKSTGPDGKTVYSDRPPTDNRPAAAMTIETPPANPLPATTLAYIEHLRKTRVAQPPVDMSSQVVLFSARWCDYCMKAKAYLSAKGIAFREIDLDSEPGMLAFAQAGGQRSIPFLVAKGQQVLGFSASSYDAVFAGKK